MIKLNVLMMPKGKLAKGLHVSQSFIQDKDIQDGRSRQFLES